MSSASVSLSWASGRRWFARSGARAALVTLVLLVSSAVFAPFLANDRPYVMVSVDRAAYDASLAELEPLVREWHVRLIAAAAAEQGVRHSDLASVHRTFEARQALARELRALELRLATLRRHAPAAREWQEPLDEFEYRLRGWTNKIAERDLDDLGPAQTLVAGAAALRERYSVGADGLELRERRSFPLLAALDVVDWFVAFAWAAVLGLALARAGWKRHVSALLAALVVAWLADAGFREPPGLSTSSVKSALATGELVASSVVFAPIAFGRDETNLSETLRPPTWWSEAELDAQGRYLRGSRARTPDPATGFVPMNEPVRVLPGEPQLNASLRHPCGTDALGRDVLARTLWGGRASLAVAFLSTVGVLLLGVLLGAAAGYARGPLDRAVSALVALLQSFPPFFLVVTAVAIGSEGPAAAQLSPLVWIVLVIVAVGWTGVARLVRAEALRVRELDYVLAAHALGFSPARVLLRHVLPNVLAPALVAAGFVAVSAILAESSVSFLGFGLRVPNPSWGALMQEARTGQHLWIFLFPGLLLLASALSLSRIGDVARAALDPREVRS